MQRIFSLREDSSTGDGLRRRFWRMEIGAVVVVVVGLGLGVDACEEEGVSIDKQQR